jgi:hypothetical protein
MAWGTPLSRTNQGVNQQILGAENLSNMPTELSIILVFHYEKKIFLVRDIFKRFSQKSVLFY